MKARLLVGFAGEVARNPGDIVDGDRAARFVAAGYAVEIEDEPVEKPVTPVAKKKTTRTKPLASETR